jgi:hypothetical protein
MSCGLTTELVALLVCCFPTVAPWDTGMRADCPAVVVNRPASTMSNRLIEAANDAARTFTADKREAFNASPMVPRAWSGPGRRSGRTNPWIKLTAPGGEPVHINVEQVTSVRPDTEMSGANTQLDLASGRFQRVRENVDQVMQLISAISDAQENDNRPSAALICPGSI